MPSGGGGGGGVGGEALISSYIRRLGTFFWVQNFDFQYFWGVSEKKYFLGMKILWIFLGGNHKIGLYLGVISMHFRVSFSQGTEWGIFWELLKFQIFFWGA